jgi:hypothetical protein
LKLAEDIGIGTRDLKRIEVIGAPITSSMVDFAKIRAARQAIQLQQQSGKRG